MKMKSFANEQFFTSWQKVLTADFPPIVAYKVKKIGDFLVSEHKKFNEIRTSILEKYGEKDEKGKLVIENNNVKVKNEDMESATKEFQELQEIDMTSAPSKLTLNDLGASKHLQLSALDFSVLEEILEHAE